MIIYKEDALKKIETWKDEDIYVVSDFDRTLTSGGSNSSWSVLANSGFLDKNYVLERELLFKKYRPIEIDESLSEEERCRSMIEWWNAHINLLIKYKLTESDLNKTASSKDIMEFRDGALSFIKSLHERNIPLIIMSAGIGNFILSFLKNNNCLFDNIYIVSNFIKFDNNVAVGFSHDIIHSLNKNEASLNEEIRKGIKNRTKVVLLGDQISDVKMACNTSDENILKIGFCEENVDNNLPYFKENFDVVATDNTNFDELKKIVKVL